MNLMDITIGEYIKKTADTYPDNIAVVDGGKANSLTWKEIDQLSDDYAKGFLSIGFGKGDHLAIWSTNKVEWILSFLGASKVGIRTIMVNVNYQFEEVRKLLIESDAKGLIFMDEFRGTDYIKVASELMKEQKSSMPKLEHFIHFGRKQCPGAINLKDLINGAEKVTTEELDQQKKSLDPHDIINIQFTSGTTSDQKGVMLTHHNLVNNSYFCGQRLKIDHRDKMCIAVSFFHCFGLSSGILMCVGSGTTMVLVESYRAVEVMKVVKQFACTVLHGVPTMFRRILDHKEFKQDDFSSLRTGIIAGASCDERTVRDIDTKMGMKQAQIGYGQTESSPGCTQTSWDDPIEKKINTIGKPLPHVEMTVKDIKTGKTCKTGITGELCTRGYHVMKGYYKNEVLTKEVIDEEGWLHTGDIGFVDEEGYYHVCGRIKDIIIRGGENISPCEVEDSLKQHPEIEDAQVYGIPEAYYGEEIATSIQLKEGSQLKENDIRHFLSTRLAHYKIPKYMEFCKEYPLTPTGKIKKYILKENMIKHKSIRRNTMNFNNQLLKGVKVVELATFIAAPACSRFLADVGAEVIKVESPAGDQLRYTAPSEGRPLDQYENTTFDLENANKKGIALNLKSPGAKEVFFKLLEDSDVFITNWRSDALERAGFDYETLKKKFPKLVYGQITGYGEKGPDKDLPGFDFTAFFARGGLLGTLYEKDTVPMNVIPGLGDHQAGMFLVSGVLAALYKARETGQGEKVAVSLFHSAMYTLGVMIQAAQYTDHGMEYPISRKDTGNPFLVAQKTKDGRFIQTCMPPYDFFYSRYMKTIGREDLMDDERYSKMENLDGRASEMHDIIAAQIVQKDAAEWDTIFREADIPFSMAQTWEEILVDEQAWANDYLYSMEYDNGNTRTLVRPPVMFTEAGLLPYDRGPLLGEHSKEIMKDHGYSDEEIKEMEESKEFYVWSDK